MRPVAFFFSSSTADLESLSVLSDLEKKNSSGTQGNQSGDETETEWNE